MPLRTLLAPLALLLGTTGLNAPASADGPPPIRYTLRFPAPETHYLEVEANIPTAGADHITLMMPVWTPGSYIVREYARHVEGLTAQGVGGKSLTVEKVRKNRWRVATAEENEVTLRYRVYGREMGVQGNWIDAGFAILNGAGTFITLVENPGTARPHEVTIELPKGWAATYTGLPDAPGGGANHYLAPDFDTLVDCPIYAGSPKVYEFTVDGKTHYLVNEGEHGVWDGPKSAKDVEAIVRAQRDFWGGLPYDKYVFFNLLTEAGGGLEHKNSTVLMASRWATRTRKGYLNWLDLVSHEYFHLWNVKRLRPVELGPFDYENEVFTRSLWVAEGVTDYYGRLFVRRAGLCSTEEYLAGRPRTRPVPGGDPDDPTDEIGRLQATPGRLVQPLETASYDAWIKFYRADENTPNTAISYYTKGALVGWLLDAEVRRATGGKKSLDDVMRLAYSRYSGAKGYTPQEFRATACEVAGADLSPFFHRCLETTEELDYAPALKRFGLQFKSADAKGDKKKADEPPKAWVGLVTKTEGGRLVVGQVKRGTPGYEAGFNVGDEIVAFGDDRVRPDGWKETLEHYRPGDKVSVLISRRDRLTRLELEFGTEPPKPWSLEIAPGASAEAKAQRQAWLAEDRAAKP